MLHSECHTWKELRKFNLGSWQMGAQEMCDGGIGEEERLSASRKSDTVKL